MHDDDSTATPSKERIAELVELYEIEAGDRGKDYTDWDDLIECDQDLTVEEWQWCQENFIVETLVTVRERGHTGWLVVAPRIVGSPESEYETIYDSDMETSATRAFAISRGFELIGSDDFLLLELVDGKATRLAWMDEGKDDGAEMLAICKQLDLEVAP